MELLNDQYFIHTIKCNSTNLFNSDTEFRKQADSSSLSQSDSWVIEITSALG